MKKGLSILMVLLFSLGAFGAITVSVQTPDPALVAGNQDIVFTVLDDDFVVGTDSLDADLYYSAAQGGQENSIDSVALDGSNCTGEDFSTQQECTYSWDSETAADGDYYFDVEASDGSENGTGSSGQFTADNTDPEISSFSIAGTDISGTLYSNTSNPKITIEASDSAGGSIEMHFSCNGSGFSSFEALASPFTGFDIASGSNGCEATETLHTVYAQVRDTAGNESTVEEFEVFYDTAPVIDSLNPESGAFMDSLSPLISAEFLEQGSGINESTILVNINGMLDFTTADAELSYNSGNQTISLDPGLSLSEGDTVSVAVDVSDNFPIPASQAAWSFTVNTEALPAITDLTASTSSCFSYVTISWTAPDSTGQGAGVDYYNVYRNGSLLDENVSGTSFTDESTDENTAYTYYVYSVDLGGKESDASNEVSVTSAYDKMPSNPTISIEDGEAYINTADVELTLIAECATHMQFSCNDTNWTNPDTSYATPYDFNLASNSAAGCIDGDGDKRVYFKASNVNGSTKTDDLIVLDRADPSFPEDPTISVSGDDATVSWEEASDPNSDISSGIDNYYVRVSSEWIEKSRDSRSHTFYDLATGRLTFCVKARDNAGNESAKKCSEGVIQDGNDGDDDDNDNDGDNGSGSTCDAVIGITAPRYAKQGEVEFSFTSSKTLRNVRIRVHVPSFGDVSGGYKTIYDSSSSTKGSGKYTFSEGMNAENRYVYVNGTDPSGNLCTKKKLFHIDAVLPEVSLMNPNDAGEFSEESNGMVLAEATDEGSYIDKLYLEYRKTGNSEWIEIAALSVVIEDNTFGKNWDKSGLEAGTYEVRARAVDEAGNEVIDSTEFSIEREVVLQDPEENEGTEEPEEAPEDDVTQPAEDDEGKAKDSSKETPVGLASMLAEFGGILSIIVVIAVVIVVALLFVSRNRSAGAMQGMGGLASLASDMKEQGLMGKISEKFKRNGKGKGSGPVSKWAYKG